MNPIRLLVRWCFNKYFRVRPPEMVKYWLHGDSARARVKKAPEGYYGMEIEGEKYLYPGFPRGHVLAKLRDDQQFPILSQLKHIIKNGFFNATWAEIERIVSEEKYSMLPPERMTPAVRELWNGFTAMEHAEVTDDMKGRVRLIKTVLCFILNEDDAYRFRFQWLMERMNHKKTHLSKADKYYFRGKYFKVDQRIKALGVDWDAFQY